MGLDEEAKRYDKMMNQAIIDLDRENYEKIARVLNSNQNNSHRINAHNFISQEVWNLSAFGFALVVTRAVPSRYLRIRCLKRLMEVTSNEIVMDQITEYLSDDKKHDSQVADNLSFELKRLEQAKNKTSVA